MVDSALPPHTHTRTRGLTFRGRTLTAAGQGWEFDVVYAHVSAVIYPSIFLMSLVYLDFKSHPWSTCLLLNLSLFLVF